MSLFIDWFDFLFMYLICFSTFLYCDVFHFITLIILLSFAGPGTGFAKRMERGGGMSCISFRPLLHTLLFFTEVPVIWHKLRKYFLPALFLQNLKDCVRVS